MARLKAKPGGILLVRVLLVSALFPAVGNLSLTLPVRAQNTQQGPLTPAPTQTIRRETNEVTPDAPLPVPEEEVVRQFSEKEDANMAARAHYSYRKTVRIQEFGPDGKPSGELLRVTEIEPRGDGRMAVRVIENPQSTLKHIYLTPEDLASFDRMPAFALITGQLAKYDLKYLGREQVDEINCYIFQVKPKMVQRTSGLFDGLVWVDAQYLDVVKTYGKWVTELGEQRPMEQLPFTLFETYRENVDGKYWLPNYARSDDTLHLKEGDFPMRITIKWTDFKAAPAALAEVPAAVSTPATPAKP